jgi:pyruvate dehydrogenase E2 component (dihydrolipoamide acetyltransferase)
VSGPTSDKRLFAITMPKWGMSMDEGTVVKWLVPVGGTVEIGTEIVEVESTKASTAIESRWAGVLLRQIALPGAVLPVRGVIGIIGDAEASVSDIDAFIREARQSENVVEARHGSGPTHVVVADQALNVVDTGSGGVGGVPLILVHGFGGMLQSWAMLQEEIAQDHRVISFDLPGHGDTNLTPRAWSLEELAHTIAQLLDALHIDRAHIVAHSMGGAVSCLAASAMPRRVASLTLIASMGFGAEIDYAYIVGFLEAKRPREFERVLGKLFASPRYVNRRMIDDIIWMKRIDGVTEALQNIADAAFLDGVQRLTDFGDKLPAIAVPVQFIWGAQDAIIPVCHATRTKFPVHVVEAAGHMPHIEQPAAVAGHVRAFITTHP